MDVLQTTSGSCEEAFVKLETGFLCNVTSVCRVCLAQDRMMRNIFDLTDSDSIGDRILYCTGVKFSQEDGLSDKICTLCFTHLTIAHKFKTKCLSADDIFCKLLKDKNTIEVSIDVKNVNAGHADDEVKVKDERFDTDDDVKDDEKSSDGSSDEIVQPTLLEKRCAGPKRKNKNRFRRLFCEICNVGFKTKAESVGHQNKMHKDNETFVCEQCGKFFTNYKSHRSHLKSHREPTNACTICDYKTPFKYALKTHMWTHTGEKKYQCDICSLTFNQNGSLVSHKKHIHSADRGYRFTCPRCDKQFQHRSQLKRHLDSHDSVKRHVCEVCSSSFMTRCYLRKHVLFKHKIVIPVIRSTGRRERNPILNDVLKEGQNDVLKDGQNDVLKEGQNDALKERQNVLKEGQNKKESK